jgi:hypothetical protein
MIFSDVFVGIGDEVVELLDNIISTLTCSSLGRALLDSERETEK